MAEMEFLGLGDQNKLKISVSSAVTSPQCHPESLSAPKCVQCIRCGVTMQEDQSVYVTIQPPSAGTRCLSDCSSNYPLKSTASDMSIETVSDDCCSKCGQINSFHVHRSQSEESMVSPSYKMVQNAPQLTLINLGGAEKGKVSESASVASDIDACLDTQKGELMTSQSVSTDIRTLETCTDCHIAVVNNQNSVVETVSLMLQIPRRYPDRTTTGSQTEDLLPITNTGGGANVLQVYPNMKNLDAGGGQALSGAKGGGYGKKLPDLDPEAEAAYLCHLRNLVACEHCGRRFNPDRVMRHEAACIERPRQKKKR